jgi:hypothetical protein
MALTAKKQAIMAILHIIETVAEQKVLVWESVLANRPGHHRRSVVYRLGFSRGGVGNWLGVTTTGKPSNQKLRPGGTP